MDEEIVFEFCENDNKVALIFSDVENQMTELKVLNESVVFDYDDKQGNKDARSHIAKLRKSKTAVSNVHKNAKAESLAFCKLLDGEKKSLISQIDEMIDVHNSPLLAIKKKEDDRIERIQLMIADIKGVEFLDFPCSIDVKKEIEKLELLDCSVGFSEFKDDAESQKKRVLRFLNDKYDMLKSAEDFEIKMKDIEERERVIAEKERDAMIVLNASTEAEKRADKAIELARVEADRVLKVAEDEAEREKIEKKARLADVEYKKRVNNTILSEIMKKGVEKSVAVSIVTDMINGKIEKVSVNY